MDEGHYTYPSSGVSTAHIPNQNYKVALVWLQKLTGILQRGRQTLYSLRRVEVLSKEAKEKYDTVISLKKKIATTRTKTLLSMMCGTTSSIVDQPNPCENELHLP